jgi:guanylate kinase
MRQGERDRVDYHFLTLEEFERGVQEGAFLEHVAYAGHRYGTLREEVERSLAEGRSVVVEIELQGARAIRRMLPDAVSIFIAPPSLAEVARRLERRATEDPDDIARRLAVGRVELEAMGEFDHRIVNADVPVAVDELATVVDAETRVEPGSP